MAHWDFAFREVADEQMSFPVVPILQSHADCLGESVVDFIFWSEDENIQGALSQHLPELLKWISEIGLEANKALTQPP